MNKLDNKIIVVTGGSGLIGKSILSHIQTLGGIGINADLNVPNDIEKGTLTCDVTNSESVLNAIDVIFKKYGKKLSNLGQVPRIGDPKQMEESMKMIGKLMKNFPK